MASVTQFVLLYFLDVLSYYCISVYREFRGGSETARNYIGTCGFIGNIAANVFLVWSFFITKWYVPVIIFVAGIISSGLPFRFDSVPFRVISPAVCLILTVLLLFMYI